MALINGDDIAIDDLISAQEETRIKNHWRLNIANLTNPSEGMIKSTPGTNLLEHCIADSTPGPIVWAEIVQGDIPLTDNVAVIVGSNSDGLIYYDEAVLNEVMIEARAHADTEGITISLLEENQKFRIRTVGGVLMWEYEWTAVGPLMTCHDVDQDTELVYGWFADDVGLLTVPANPLREQILTNSGIGYWPQSDANKGIAALVFDNGTVAPVVGEAIVGGLATGKVMWVNVTNNDWGGGNGAGTCYLGSVTGAYIDNETIAGSVAAAFDVNGDLDIGVKNDPMNDDSVAAVWTDDGVNITLTHVGALYTVVTAAANQRAWIVAAPLTAGKIYKIEADIKDGSVANRNVQGYFNDGAAQYGMSKTTGVAWASVSWVFECATTTAAGLVGFRVVENMGGGGNNFEIRNFSCYEITPGCTVADTVAFDTWYKSATMDIYREHNDGGTNTHDGSFYSLKIVPASASIQLDWNYSLRNLAEYYQQFNSRTVAFGAWFKTNTASHARLNIYDGVTNNYSDYHSGGGAWEWLELTAIIGAATSLFRVRIMTDVAGDIDGTTIIYVSQPMLSFGASLGIGNYRPRQQEFIFGEVPILSNVYDNTTGWSDLAYANLNLEADSDARIPKGVQAILVHSGLIDSGSGAASNVHLCLRSDAVFATMSYTNSVAGKASTIESHSQGIQGCDANGDVDIHLDASGPNTLDIPMFEYHGVQVN